MKPRDGCRLLFAVLVPAALSCGQRAEDQDLEFVRGLAADWGFVELAMRELEQLAREPTVDAKRQERISAVAAEVYALAAGRERDQRRRAELLRAAVQRFEDHLQTWGRAQTRVLASFAATCEAYAVELARSRKNDAGTVDREAVRVLELGVRACDDISARDGEELSAHERTRALLRKGSLFLRWAEADRNDRVVKGIDSYEAFENAVLEAGEGSLLGMHGLLGLVDALVAMKQTPDALALAGDLVTQLVDRLRDTTVPISPKLAAAMFEIVERAYAVRTRIYEASGQHGKVLAAVDEYRAHARTLGIAPTRAHGDRVLIAGLRARVATDAQGPSIETLKAALALRGRHRGDEIAERARAILRMAPPAGKGDAFLAEVAYESALAELLLQKHRFRQALALIDDARTAGNDNPSLVRLKVRVLGGWAELDANSRLRIVPGLGRYREAYELLRTKSRKHVAASHAAYSLEWYRFQFDCMDLALKIAATGDSDYARIAKAYRRIAASVDDFATLEQLGAEGKRLRLLFLLRR